MLKAFKSHSLDKRRHRDSSHPACLAAIRGPLGSHAVSLPGINQDLVSLSTRTSIGGVTELASDFRRHVRPRFGEDLGHHGIGIVRLKAPGFAI